LARIAAPIESTRYALSLGRIFGPSEAPLRTL